MVSHVLIEFVLILKLFEAIEITTIKWLKIRDPFDLTVQSAAITARIRIFLVALVTKVVAAWLRNYSDVDWVATNWAKLGFLRTSLRIYLHIFIKYPHCSICKEIDFIIVRWIKHNLTLFNHYYQSIINNITPILHFLLFSINNWEHIVDFLHLSEEFIELTHC